MPMRNRWSKAPKYVQDHFGSHLLTIQLDENLTFTEMEKICIEKVRVLYALFDNSAGATVCMRIDTQEEFDSKPWSDSFYVRFYGIEDSDASIYPA